MSNGIQVQILEALGGVYDPGRGIETQILAQINSSGSWVRPFGQVTDLNETSPTVANVGKVNVVATSGAELSFFQLVESTEADDGTDWLRPSNYDDPDFTYVYHKLTVV